MKETGRWLTVHRYMPVMGYLTYTVCSICGYEFNDEYYFEPINFFKYCPNCGAKMEQGVDDEHTD